MRPCAGRFTLATLPPGRYEDNEKTSLLASRHKPWLLLFLPLLDPRAIPVPRFCALGWKRTDVGRQISARAGFCQRRIRRQLQIVRIVRKPRHHFDSIVENVVGSGRNPRFFHEAGAVLIRPILTMKSAHFMVACGFRIYR